MKSIFSLLTSFSATALALALTTPYHNNGLRLRQSSNSTSTNTTNCANGPNSRGCWGDYSIDTNFYDVTPHTGVIREYWLSVQNGTCSPDGYRRSCLTFNGTIPGPEISADWGDTLVIHVTNNLDNNGTAIHWHGIRQLGSVEMDGVPGVTQCPIAPGETQTYRFRVQQYGSTWYHSHLSLQYADGLFGPLVLRGPSTADYDEDLGALFLQDWGHQTVFSRWPTARVGAPPALENGLINGTNTFNCNGSSDPNCVGGGKKFEITFKKGTKYLLRIVNVATDGHFQFSIDGHSLTVMGNDLVPIKPYTADSILVSIGQRYDVVVEANADSGSYWLRAGWVSACAGNNNAADMTAIVRYDSTDTSTPTTTSNVTTVATCGDEPLESLVPHLSLDVTDIPIIAKENLGFVVDSYFKWTINSSSLFLNWSNPTVLQVLNNESVFPTEYNVVSVDKTKSSDEWAVLVIQDTTGFGLFHPIHLHGHDFWILAQTTGTFDGTTSSFNTKNPPRRDVASLPGNGYLAIAFKLDNPGAWLVHCHIAWHASEGLSLEFVESQSQISVADPSGFRDQCSTWNNWTPKEIWPQDDSGI